jgi:hypothetical protein
VVPSFASTSLGQSTDLVLPPLPSTTLFTRSTSDDWSMVDLPQAATPSNRAAAAMKAKGNLSMGGPYSDRRADEPAPYRGGA